MTIKRSFITTKEDINPVDYELFKNHVRTVLEAEAAFIGIGQQ